MAFKYRYVQIEDDKSVADSGTLTIDLNVKDPLTALILRFKVTNSTSAVKEQPPDLEISKVEIVDGGQVYFSLTGPQLVAASVYGLGRWPHSWYDERANNNQRINPTILFGRFLGDELYAFDPRRLTNPQLKITWTDNANYAANSYAIGLTAVVMEGLSAPPEMLAWKEIESWTTAASGVKTIELPIDYVYRALMMRPYAAGTVWNTIWSNFKLDCDVGKFIPFDLNQHELRDILRQQFGPYQAFYHLVQGNNVQVEAWMGECLAASGIHQTTPPSIIALYSAGAWPVFFVYGCDNAGVAIDDALIEATAWGVFPHTCVLWPFGDWMKPETWWNPRDYGQIDLKITEAIASAAGSVMLQQVRPVP